MKTKIVLLLAIMTLQANAQLIPVAYKDGSQKLNGFLATAVSQQKKNPGILILPAWMGISTHSKEVAEKLAGLGYHAFIADIYGEGNYPSTTQEAGKQAGLYKKDFKAYQKRISLALDELIKGGADPDNIVIIGYCFGGTGALEAARAGLPVQGVVSFHGGLGKDNARANLTVKPKVLVLHGADDPFVSKEEIEAFQKEMKDGKADWQMIYYGNAVHAFTEKEAGHDNSKGAAYNNNADKRSWRHFIMFLEELFRRK